MIIFFGLLTAGIIAGVFVARGSVSANGQALAQGDALRLDGTSRLTLAQGQAAEVLVFDLAA